VWCTQKKNPRRAEDAESRIRLAATGQQIKRGVAVVIDGYIYRCFLGGDVARGRQVSEEENIIGHHRDDDRTPRKSFTGRAHGRPLLSGLLLYISK
jgi:hypothetical protein